jgi:hypothetical protein
VINRKKKIVGRWKQLETLYPSTNVKRKRKTRWKRREKKERRFSGT